MQARPTYPSVDGVVTSVLSLVGVHIHALHAMLTVSSVEWSTDISTACVECVDRPRPVNVAVYVDVSGRMDLLFPHLRRTLLTVSARIQPTLYWFPTGVVEAKRRELERGVLPTIGGTAIGPVIAHALSQRHTTHAAVIITDGYVERVSRASANAVRDDGLSLHLGIPGGGPTLASAPWVAFSTPLPSPRIAQGVRP